MLPLFALGIGGFATMTFLTKNSFLDEIRKQYVTTARAKGLHRKAQCSMAMCSATPCCLVISGFPGAFLGAFFAGSLLIEQIFSLDGLGYLTYKAALDRDYPVVFANLYIFTLVGLVVALISDLTYTWIDPRIDFEVSGNLGNGVRSSSARSTSVGGSFSSATAAASGHSGFSWFCS